ncbi:MAG: pyridoxal phosphate-dependent aminotransferase [Longimicrobiales bacterium]|nr:pyridoxal phosphate-dependent aminotransferase [Longimicrobiales bacterium]
MKISENVKAMRPSATIAVSSLARQLASEGRDILNLSAGEPDFGTPEFVAEAAITGIRQGRTTYTPAAGLPELRRAIASDLTRQRGREVPFEAVVVSSGAKQSLFNACFSLFGPGDEVLIGAPYWTSYPEIVGLARATAVPVAGAEARDFRLTPDDLEAARTPGTRGLIFSSPSNPTGVVYSAAELEAIAGWARERGVWLIADEIYRRIHFGDAPEAPSILGLDPSHLGDHVLIDGASKAFAMTGWRIGFSMSSPELAETMTALQSHTTSNAATPSQVAALAAWTETERTDAAVAEMREAFRRRRDLVCRRFDEKLPGIPYLRPEGAFYLFFRVDGAFDAEHESAADLCTWILEEVGVALVPGEAFGEPRFVRMSYATSDAVLEDAIDRLATLLA